LVVVVVQCRSELHLLARKSAPALRKHLATRIIRLFLRSFLCAETSCTDFGLSARFTRGCPLSVDLCEEEKDEEEEKRRELRKD